MKKWGILLGLVAIVSIISEVIADSKRIEEPVILDVVMDFDFNSIDVSYISNTKEPMRVEWLEINGKSYYPENWRYDLFGEGSFSNASYVAAPYYAVYYEQSRIDELGREELLSNLPSVRKANIYFTGQAKAYEADVLIIPPSSDIGITVNGWERSAGRMELSIIAEEELTFTDITLANTFGKIMQFEKNEKSESLPVTLQEGDKLQVVLEEMVSTYPTQQAYIRLSGQAGDKKFNEIQGDMINQPPSAAWVKERVEEHLE